jgi:single-stranded DNA-binding protein
MNISAKIIEIFETANVTETFKKREFVVEYSENPQYPEYIKFEFIQDKCEILNNYKVGDEVDISFNLKGRKWTDPQGTVKYFNTLQAWRLDKKSADAENSDGAQPPMEEPEWLADKGEGENDLPF